MPRDGDVRLLAGPRARPRDGRPSVSGPEPAAGPDRAARLSDASSATCSRSRRRRAATARPRDELSRRFPTRIGVDGRRPRSRSRAAAARSREPIVAAKKDTNPLTEIEMVNNRPTPDARRGRPGGVLPPASVDARPRRRADRGDHVLHEHLEPERSCSAPALLAKKAVERGLTVPPYVKASLAPGSRVVTDYLARAGPSAVPRPARLPPRRLRLHDLHRQLRPARSARRGGRHGARPHRGVRALGQPQLRGADPPEHQGELPDEPAARRRLRARRPRRHRPDDRAARQRQRAARRLPARHLALLRGGRAAAAGRRRPGLLPPPLRRAAEENPLWNDIPAADRQRSTRGTTSSTYIQEPPFFENFSMTPGDVCRHQGRAGAGDLRRLGDDGPHQPRRRHQERQSRRASTSRSAGSRPRTSTATARGAATTAS